MDKDRARELVDRLSRLICDAEDDIVEKLVKNIDEETSDEIGELKSENARLKRERDTAVAELISRQPMTQDEAADFLENMRALRDNICGVLESTKFMRETGFGTLDAVARRIGDVCKSVYVNSRFGGIPE
jgi:hypothetical protein